VKPLISIIMSIKSVLFKYCSLGSGAVACQSTPWVGQCAVSYSYPCCCLMADLGFIPLIFSHPNTALVIPVLGTQGGDLCPLLCSSVCILCGSYSWKFWCSGGVLQDSRIHSRHILCRNICLSHWPWLMSATEINSTDKTLHKNTNYSLCASVNIDHVENCSN